MMPETLSSINYHWKAIEQLFHYLEYDRLSKQDCQGIFKTLSSMQSSLGKYHHIMLLLASDIISGEIKFERKKNAHT